MRLTYPGITELVVVKSIYNDTPAGRAAIDAVATYNSALARATTDQTIAPARRLAAPGCRQCQSDINRIAGYIARKQRVVRDDGSPNTWTQAAIFVESISPAGLAVVEFDASQPAVKLVNVDGSVIAHNTHSQASDVVVVDLNGESRSILDVQIL